MSIILNNRQWKKAYMLEFFYNNETTPKVFTFSVPPESEEFSFTHRLSETKTYGGSVFDSYGNDTVKINLSGSTINEERKLIYRGNRQLPSYLTGEQEVWELQKLIKESQDIKNKGTLKVYLYDLSKMGGGIQKGLNLLYGISTKNWWRVYIKDFKIKRDKSKPNTYNYSMELLGIEDDNHKRESFFDNENNEWSELAEKVNSLSDKIVEYSTMGELMIDSGAQVVQSFGLALGKLQQIGSSEPPIIGLANGVTRLINGSDAVNDVYNSCVNASTAIRNFVTGQYMTKRAATESIQTYTVSFDSDGGSIVNPQSITYGNYVELPENPVKKYYDFAGWYYNDMPYDFNQPVTSNMTLSAKWIKNTVLVSFSPNGGTIVPSQYVRIGGKVEYPEEPTKQGFVFSKWTIDYAGSTAFDFNTPVTTDTQLYAQWIEAVSVVFDSNGGSEVETQSFAPGEKAIFPPIPVLPDCALVYWSDKQNLSTEYDFSKPVTNNMTLWAKWKQITATLTFESNGGTAVAPVIVTYGHKTSSPKSTKEGFVLTAWCKDPELTNEFFFATTNCTESLTLYAKWDPAILDVTFDSLGGSSIAMQKVEYNGLAVYPEIPVKSGNTFLWWEYRVEVSPETSETITVGEGEDAHEETIVHPAVYEYHRFDFNTAVKESITLYAKWFEE